MQLHREHLPNKIGVMALPGASLFPGSLLPLYIFEQRYCDMLNQALASHRMFAIAMQRISGDDSEVFDIGGAGIIRACVQKEDGTSNLVLQGIKRVRFVKWLQIEPYRIAEIEPLNSIKQPTSELKGLAVKVQKLCKALKEQGTKLPKQFDKYLSQIRDAEIFSDVICATLVADPLIRQKLLEELDVSARLRQLIACLQGLLR